MGTHSDGELEGEASGDSFPQEQVETNPVAATAKAAMPLQSKISETYIRKLAIIIPLGGLACAFLYSLTAWTSRSAWRPFLHALITFVLISGASFFIGALLGFLFGFPRAAEDVTGDSRAIRLRYGHNKNLEQISDWVIKMLIGIGLSQMRDFPGALWRAASRLTLGVTTLGNIPDESGKATAPAAASCLILFFLICGFIEGYLATRLLLPSKLVEVDKTST